MKFSPLFIYRPVATILISLAITLCGILRFRLLPIAPLPQVDFPVIMISASLPGASPETMASSVATPLERSLGRIAGVNEMTSSSSLSGTRIIMEFNFDRDINGAARDVQAAINARAKPAAERDAQPPPISQSLTVRCADHDPDAHLGYLFARRVVRFRVNPAGANHRAD